MASRSASPPGCVSFVRSQYSRVVSLAAAASGSLSDGDDIAQAAMLKAAKHWDEVSRMESPAAWVSRVAINLAIDTKRKAQRDQQKLVVLGQQPRNHNTLAEEANSELLEALRQLPPQQRAAVALHYLNDESVAGVAAALGCSVSTAKVHLHRGRAALRNSLTPAAHASINASTTRGQS
jgi:RNA polymerase sigma-70 factor (ECF subfamily)